MLTLAQALEELPDTADNLAAWLAEQGIRGVRENQDCCPIANYLTGLGFNHVTVDDSYVQAYSDVTGWDGEEPESSVTEFVTRFDKGEWPELEVDDA